MFLPQAVITWMASYKVTCICFHTVCSVGAELKSTAPNTNPLSTFLLQAALFRVFPETALGYNSPQHIGSDTLNCYYLLLLANVLNLRVKGRKLKGECRAVLCMGFGLKDTARFALTMHVVCGFFLFFFLPRFVLDESFASFNFSIVLERKEMHICSCSETQLTGNWFM